MCVCIWVKSIVSYSLNPLPVSAIMWCLALYAFWVDVEVIGMFGGI